MLIPPNYILTPPISQSLQTIEANRQLIDAIQIPPEVETNIRRQSTLKSSLFSARIEGNPLTLDELGEKSSSDLKKKEVFNILKALQFVHERGFRDITINVITQLHTKTMNDLINKSNFGTFRKEVSAIFNTSGLAIYMPPPPSQINYLMERLVKFIHSDKEQFIPIKAALIHYTFEKIHPFLDGNGRVGRLLFQLILQKGGYGMKQLVSIEEYLDNHRSHYYGALEARERDVTEYIEFMLQALANTSDKTKQLILMKEKFQIQDYLLPRRAEIYNVIKDHRIVNFDMIKRRFMAINERTLRYDLKKLTDAKLIKKLGTTKGVYYEAINSQF